MSTTNSIAGRDAMTARIAPCNRECIPRHVGRDDPRNAGTRARGYRHASTTGTDVRDARAAGRVVHEKRQAALDDQFGFRPRNQYGRRHLEVEAPELSVSDDVGHWLVALAQCDPLRIGRPICSGTGSVPSREQSRAIPAEDRAGAGLPHRLMLRPAECRRATNRSRAATTSAWITRLVSVASLSLLGVVEGDHLVESSARSPSSTSCSWWVVKLMRWSVIRLCGKL